MTEQALTKLNEINFADFNETVEKTLYISGKDWKARHNTDRPLKIVGFYKQTYFKIYDDKPKANHVVMTSKGDVVLNGCGDLDARFEKIPAGACIMVEYIGEKPSKKGMPALVFEIRRNKSYDMSSEETRAMLEEISRQQVKFREAPVQEAPKALVVRDDLPF